MCCICICSVRVCVCVVAAAAATVGKSAIKKKNICYVDIFNIFMEYAGECIHGEEQKVLKL